MTSKMRDVEAEDVEVGGPDAERFDPEDNRDYWFGAMLETSQQFMEDGQELEPVGFILFEKPDAKEGEVGMVPLAIAEKEHWGKLISESLERGREEVDDAYSEEKVGFVTSAFARNYEDEDVEDMEDITPPSHDPASVHTGIAIETDGENRRAFMCQYELSEEGEVTEYTPWFEADLSEVGLSGRLLDAIESGL